MAAMSDELSAEESEQVKASPFFGIIVDESTDVSVEEHLLVYVVFMRGFEVLVGRYRCFH